jgi:hypothetical protein
MKVDFGMTDESPSGQYSISGIRSHDELRRRLGRRQAAASSTVVYPTTPSSLSSVQNLNFNNFNKSLLSVSGVTIGCHNCTLVGSLDITQGTFVVNNSATNKFDQAFQFIEEGFFNVVANGLSAHIELDTSVTLSLDFDKVVFREPLSPFQVCIFCFTMLFIQYSAI